MNVARQVLISGRLASLSNLTLKSACTRSYAFKSDLKIKWVRPEKIPCIKPEKSGDLDPMMQMDLSQPQLEFRSSKELETADETVKKLFSLQYAPRKKLTQAYFADMKEIVKRHDFDNGSVEVQLARWTGVIRAFQELMERFPRDKITKVILKELIERRKKKLKYLRRWDYKRFEWVLETLNLVYKPTPAQVIRVERKASLRKLTDKYCQELKEDRLKTYREMLEAEQPVFLQEKIRALEFIKNEQSECGVEVTVTDEEINEVKQQLKELEEKRQTKNDDL